MAEFLFELVMKRGRHLLANYGQANMNLPDDSFAAGQLVDYRPCYFVARQDAVQVVSGKQHRAIDSKFAVYFLPLGPSCFGDLQLQFLPSQIDHPTNNFEFSGGTGLLGCEEFEFQFGILVGNNRQAVNFPIWFAVCRGLTGESDDHSLLEEAGREGAGNRNFGRHVHGYPGNRDRLFVPVLYFAGDNLAAVQRDRNVARLGVANRSGNSGLARDPHLP